MFLEQKLLSMFFLLILILVFLIDKCSHLYMPLVRYTHKLNYVYSHLVPFYFTLLHQYSTPTHVHTRTTVLKFQNAYSQITIIAVYRPRERVYIEKLLTVYIWTLYIWTINLYGGKTIYLDWHCSAAKRRVPETWTHCTSLRSEIIHFVYFLSSIIAYWHVVLYFATAFRPASAVSYRAIYRVSVWQPRRPWPHAEIAKIEDTETFIQQSVFGYTNEIRSTEILVERKRTYLSQSINYLTFLPVINAKIYE